jgi:hypothetical protein
MALGCGLTSVRGNRGENYENEPLVHQKHTKKKKNVLAGEGEMWGRGKWRGLSEGFKNGQLTLGMGSAKMGIRDYV